MMFEELAAEYKLEPNQIKSIKKFAAKYSLLKDVNLPDFVNAFSFIIFFTQVKS